MAAGPPPPRHSHWICTIATSDTGRRWGSGPQVQDRPPPLPTNNLSRCLWPCYVNLVAVRRRYGEVPKDTRPAVIGDKRHCVTKLLSTLRSIVLAQFVRRVGRQNDPPPVGRNHATYLASWLVSDL